MSDGDHADRSSLPRGRHAARWVAAAAALLVALLVVLQHEPAQPVAQTPRSAGEAASVPGFALAEQGGDTLAPSPLAAGNALPQPLASNTATLIVQLEDTGLLASTPFLAVTRPADGTREVRSLAAGGETRWPDIPVGTYTLAMSTGDWSLDESSVTLEPGDVRTVSIAPRRALVVRAVGALSGRPVTLRSVSLQGRDDNRFQSGLAAETFEPPVAQFALLGLPERFEGRVLREFQMVASSSSEAEGRSGWLTLQAVDATRVLVLRVAEPVIVGRVHRASADDPDRPAGSPPFPRGADVQLLPVGKSATQREVDVPGLYGRQPFTRLTSALSEDISDTQGEYVLRLSELPDQPVHVVAMDGLDRPADSGPIDLARAALPLRVDLQLEPAGRIRGTVSVAVTTDAEGNRVPAMVLMEVRARPVGEPAGVSGRPGDLLRQPLDLSGHMTLLPFLVGGLPAGEFDVEVRLAPQRGVDDVAGARRLVERVAVLAGETAEVHLDAHVVPSGSTVRGQLRLPPGFDMAETMITLRQAEDGSVPQYDVAESMADSLGRFAFLDVVPGEYSVSATAYARREQAMAQARVTVGASDADVILDLTQPELVVRSRSRNARRVMLSREGEHSHWALYPDKDGLARGYGLAPGRWRAVADQHEPVTFEIAEGATLITVEVP